MLKGYGDGSFGGGSGPSYKSLQEREATRANSITGKLLDDNDDVDLTVSSNREEKKGRTKITFVEAEVKISLVVVGW